MNIRLNSDSKQIRLTSREYAIKFEQIGKRGLKGDKGDQGDPANAPVTSVNSKEGAVVLTAADVGADTAGSAASALTSANTYTDAGLTNKVDKVAGKQLSSNDYTLSEKNKLSGIASFATQNDSNADLRDRTTHTGEQPISTVTGLQTSLDGKADNGDVISDHGALTGLAEDDHPQYHNDARGDVRYLQKTGGDLTGAVRLNTAGAPEQLAVRSYDEDNSAIGFVGQETGKGTVKITHNIPTSGASDANAAGVSINLAGIGTAAKGLYIDATNGGTTGNLVQIRNNGADKFIIDKDGSLTRGLYVKSTALNSDALRVDASDGSRLARLVETGGGHGWFEVDNSTGVAQVLFRADGGDNYLLSGKLGIGTSSPSNALDLNGDSVRIRTSKTPSTATSTGNQGEIAWDTGYMYVCVATNTWKRSALSSW